MPKIGNIFFTEEFFNDYIKTIFEESFTHSSLSFEKAFQKSKYFSAQLKEFISPKNIEYAKKLEQSSNPKDQELLEQRLKETRQVLLYFQIPENPIENEYNIVLPGIDAYKEYFLGCVRPYRNTKEYKDAELNSELTGESYEKETLMKKGQDLSQLIIEKVQADLNAKLLKKANNEAFEYALSKDTITLTDIQEINAIINLESGVQRGYRIINNQINNCPFETCPKELVPVRMQEIMYHYTHEWADEIPIYIPGVSTEQEKEEYLLALCEREAKFHIEFERIHPFEDGNGRTGRIILNQHLIKNEMAPILITPEMRKYYIECIDNEDYKRLGIFIYMLSSVQLNDMMSNYRNKVGLRPEELSYSEIGGPIIKQN